MTTHFTSVDDYLDAQPDHVRGVVTHVRNIIRMPLPKAEEVISYQIPAYKLNGERVIYFAGWKQALFALSRRPALVAAFKDELAPYELSKGTIRVPLSDPVTAKLIAQIAKFRAKEASVRRPGQSQAKRVS